MSNKGPKRKRILFVDDDPAFLENLAALLAHLSGGSWEILTASSHARALERLVEGPADLLVVDIGMPVMDGLQFLRLLKHTHPGQQAVVLSGLGSRENRQASLDAGAVLFLEKPRRTEDYQALFAALDALASVASQGGFHGMMRRVGLQDVLQMECLSRKSSVLEIFTGSVRGRVHIFEGNIVHAESGGLQGEMGLYALLGLRAGDFNFLPYTEPVARTITTNYEFLLMEAARLADETAASGSKSEPSDPPGGHGYATEKVAESRADPEPDLMFPQVAEMLLCTGSGEVLFEHGCEAARRLAQLETVEEQASELGVLLTAGRFDRFEMLAPGERLVCQIQPHMRLLVRTESPFLT